MTAEFTSKVFEMPAPVNLAVAEVIADAYPTTLTVYADARAPWVKTVSNRKPFTLPGGFLADTYQVKVGTALDTTKVTLAESITELSQQ
jgi:hypothetical protein